MRLATVVSVVAVLGIGAGCDKEKFTVAQTAPVLLSAQASLQQESDYELAARAVPGALKTVEGFWVVSPDNDALTEILTEGYCQYGTAFVEDEWEAADLDHKLDERDYHNTRATKAFTRCLNYALHELGGRWQKELFLTPDVQDKLIKETGSGKRTPLMWAALAVGSIVNHNKNRPEALSYIEVAHKMLDRVVEMDAKNPPKDPMMAALPHVALGMIFSATGKDFGGKVDDAEREFKLALSITKDRMLLARALYAKQVGKMKNDEKFFHEQLVQVLDTDPGIWPEQRLANEVAHRKARRYLAHEKDLFR